jgi:hypothetical protein
MLRDLPEPVNRAEAGGVGHEQTTTGMGELGGPIPPPSGGVARTPAAGAFFAVCRKIFLLLAFFWRVLL